ncbi:hypothetical protein B0T14DRAFT_513815 [Immersiella caudata]|uniref:Uncharacterized protein n=1 Tax=Immersiella caudata TaxID=314043 RepID=A0AA39WVJ3_9PEZI|nr:hypothetical protein B0T14DRAFT_513815 [Immersiella caudata]
MQSPARPRRPPLPQAAMRRSRLPLPLKPVGHNASPSPGCCPTNNKPPVGQPPAQGPEIDDAPLTTSLLSPLFAHYPHFRHKRSPSVDSAIGSSVASTNGDAADAPITDPPPTVPRSGPLAVTKAFIDDATMIQGGTDDSTDEELVWGRLFIAVEVADCALRKLLGVTFKALELQDTIVAITETYLLDLVDFVKKDSHCGASVAAQDPGDSPSTGSPSGQQRTDDGEGRGFRAKTVFVSRLPKRTRLLDDDEIDDDRGEDGGRDKRRATSTRAAKGSADTDTTPYSCPFRKMSPTLFHVRDHPKCANQPWIGMTNLKLDTPAIFSTALIGDMLTASRRHITSDHYFNRFPCPRCGSNIGSADGLQKHVLRPVPCSPQAVPAIMTRLEDGISYNTREILASRKGDKKVTNWPRLWAVLFGDDVPIMDSDFVPVVELEEVSVDFEKQLPALMALSDRSKGWEDNTNLLVQLRMRELLDKCREIPFRKPASSAPSILATPTCDDVISGGESIFPVKDGHAGDENDCDILWTLFKFSAKEHDLLAENRGSTAFSSEAASDTMWSNQFHEGGLDSVVETQQPNLYDSHGDQTLFTTFQTGVLPMTSTPGRSPARQHRHPRYGQGGC